MPLRLEIKKKLTSRSDRVKAVDLHETQPWVLAALYNGNVMIWNYETQQLLKSFEMTDLPVRAAKFIERKQWIVAVADDMLLRCHNYNTTEKVIAVEAHTDYIRCVEVHPTKPIVLTSSDDMQIKLWDWERNWQCTQVFEGHSHYVMMVKFNPKDTNTFASASLDKTVKVWGLGSATPHFSLEGHERGVNCVDYYPGGDKPYLISGADDRLVKIWDYQTKACVQTLDGHTHNVTHVAFHPRLPIILSTSEDGTARMWHSTTYRAETTLNYGMERAWAVAVQASSNKVALGYDEGTIVVRLGHEMPVVSMEASGKLLWAVNNDIKTSSIRGLASESNVQDGERLPVVSKDLGSCEIYPQRLEHNSNGRFVAVCGDGEYIIYTSQALRNKAYGSALDFVWSAMGTGDFCVRESISRIKLFKNFKESKVERPRLCPAESLMGGHLVGVRGNDCIVFYDWDDLRLVRKIDVLPRNIYWSEGGDLVVLACEESFYVLRYNKEATADAFARGTASPDEGVEGAFDLLHEISDKVRTGQWVGDCFVHTNQNSRLNYYVGGEVMTIAHLERPMYLLGYVAREGRVFLIDKSLNVVSYSLNMSVLEYQTAVVRGDFDTANSILANVPQDQYDKIARFLESQGFKEEALAISRDPDQKFDLALQLNKLSVAHKIMVEEIGHADTTDAQHKWKQLGDLATAQHDIQLAEDCAMRAEDLSGLLLLRSCRGDAKGMEQLAQIAKKQKKFNVAFLCLFLSGKLDECIDLLVETGRIAEACFLTRTYRPSRIPEVVDLWRKDLANISTRAAASLADSKSNPNLFPDLETALKVEQMMELERKSLRPASQYTQMKSFLEKDWLAALKEGREEGFPDKGGEELPGPEIYGTKADAAFAHSEEQPVEEEDEDDDVEAASAQETARLMEQERQRRAEEEAALRRQQEEELRRRQQEQEEAAAEAERRRRAEEEQRRRQQEEEEEEERRRQEEAEEERRRQAEAAEAELRRQEEAAEAERRRQEAETEMKRKAEEEERRRRQQEEEELERKKQEELQRKQQQEEELERKRQEELLRRQQEEEEQAQRRRQEEQERLARQQEEAERRRREEDQEQARRAAEEAQEAERQRQEELERQAELQRRAEEEAHRQREEALRLQQQQQKQQQQQQQQQQQDEEEEAKERQRKMAEEEELNFSAWGNDGGHDTGESSTDPFAELGAQDNFNFGMDDDALEKEAQKAAMELSLEDDNDDLDFDDEADWGEM